MDFAYCRRHADYRRPGFWHSPAWISRYPHWGTRYPGLSSRLAPPAKPADGWSLGPGLRITDPERPERLSDVILPLKALSLGVLGIGSPGSGKTESLLIGLLGYIGSLHPRTGWAAFDGKGQLDIFQKTVASGCPPDHFFSTELTHSASMNLMAGNPEDVTDRLSKVLIGEAASTTYYADDQRSVLLIVVPLMLGLGLKVNLRDLYVALSVENAGAELLLLAQENGVDEHILKSARSWYSLEFTSRPESTISRGF